VEAPPSPGGLAGRMGPPTYVLKHAPEVTVARAVLGLTLYLDDMPAWAGGGLAYAVRAVLDLVGTERLAWYTTSVLSDWRRVTGPMRLALLDELDRPGPLRHLWWMRLVDDPGAPGAGLSYREVDEARGRTGFLQIFLPADSDPAQLLALAGSLGDRFGFASGVGGFLATWNQHEKPAAFRDIHGWSRRFLGLDVQDPDAMAWHARRRLPGTNWLTLVGARFAEAAAVTAAMCAPGPAAVKVTPLRHGLLVQAGEQPTWGDLNRGSYPAAYAAVARRLEPWICAAELVLWGGFHRHEHTGPWLRRFVEPGRWA
jgi:hypothetical protein